MLLGYFYQRENKTLASLCFCFDHFTLFYIYFMISFAQLPYQPLQPSTDVNIPCKKTYKYYKIKFEFL